jgi:outer membrane lipoprotein SlyB
MGALGGGAAGYFAGNKKGHGVIGAIAGAVFGSKAEDHFKKPKHGNGGW